MRASAGKAQVGGGVDEAEQGDGHQYLFFRQRRAVLQRSARNGAEQVDGNGLYPQLFQGESKLNALFHRLAHADDAAAANVHACVAGCLQGAQLVFLRVRAAQGGEERGGCFQVAVVAGDAGIVQGAQLFFGQQA